MPNKIYIAGRNQTKTVTPSNIQQTVVPDSEYNALNSVVVNPIKAAMPQTIEQFIMRDQNMEPFSVNLDGAVPDYACYQQKNLVAVYGTPTSVGDCAFQDCTRLVEVDCSDVVSIESYAFYGCTLLQNLNCRSALTIGGYALNSCAGLAAVDLRNISELTAQTLRSCRNIKGVDLRNVSRIYSYNFYSMGTDFFLDITNSHNAVLDNNNTSLGGTNVVILVANDTDKAHYQSATNWSAFASQIKTVAEFEQEVGMSYDVYYEQIFGHPRFDS